MDEAILKAVQDSLPAATAGELSRFIQQANRDKIKLSELEQVLTKELAEKRIQQDRINKLTEELCNVQDINLRERNVTESEQRLALTIAEIRRDCAIDTTNKILELAGIAFRNPRLVHNESGSMPCPVPQGGYSGTVGYNKTISTEELK